MDLLTLALFCLILLSSIIFDISLIIALLLGLVLFITYGLIRGHSLKEMLRMALSGIKTVKNILIIFAVIGMLTALWRASGTIPTIVSYSSLLITPSIFVLLAFLLNALLSTLTGTSFGTGATMGVICVSIAKVMGIDLLWVGGAVLAGCYYGDRCSPVSTSALLVSTVTETNLYANIKNMYRSCIIPTIITCAVYTVAGFAVSGEGTVIDVHSLFSSVFLITPVALIPAITVLILAIFRVSVRKLLLTSNLFAFLIALLVQKVPFAVLLKYILLGFQTADEALAPMINGGGLISMLRVGCIVCIASSYSGIFSGTGLLEPVKEYIRRLSSRTTPFIATFAAGIAASCFACNQSLSILLTEQLCSGITEDKNEMALYLEDTAVIIAPLVPWSIAGTVVLATIGAPLSALAASVYLYILPIWRCCISVSRRSR